MSTRQIHIFISHAWAHSEHYNTLASWIFNEPWSVGQASLDFRDYSVPKNNPIHNARNNAELYAAICGQIKLSHVVVIPTGMYANYSNWIQKEIDAAILFNKPILAVSPWGQVRESSVVLDNAHENVGWNKQPVINSIWQLYYKNNA